MKNLLSYLLLVMLLVACNDNFEEQYFEPVARPIQSYNILLDGDSRTDGWNCEKEFPYIDLLNLGDSVSIKKVSYGGATIRELLDRDSSFYLRHFQASKKDNILVIWIGANDLNVNNDVAGTVYKNLVRYCYKRKTEGWKIIVGSEISIKGGVGGYFDKQRLIYNQLIYFTYRDFCNGLADLSSNPEIGLSGAHENSVYFCDGVHLTNSGTRLVAKTIERAILDQMNSPQTTIIWDGEFK